MLRVSESWRPAEADSVKGDSRRNRNASARVMSWAAEIRFCGLSRLSEALSKVRAKIQDFIISESVPRSVSETLCGIFNLQINEEEEIMRRRIFAGMMAAAMVAGLTACGSSSEAETTAAQGAAEEGTESGAESGLEDGVLSVAMECSYAPYNWTQQDDSNGAVQIKGSSDYAYGYDVMMAKHIAEALGVDLEIVKSDWDSLVPAVQSGTVDCVIAGQSITSERLQSVDFSEPYYYASVVAVTKKDSPYANAQGVSDLAGATVTSQQNTIWYDSCLPQIEGADILAAQESAPAMLVALESGRVDLVVTDMPTAQAACVAYPDMVLLDFTGSDDDFEVSEEDINIGISMRKGNSALKEQIDSVLSEMNVDDFNEMMDEAISVQPLSE